MTYRLGLTGSIGMGKSTAASMFREMGVPVWDADEAVHRLYAAGGAAVGPVAAVFPTALAQGAIDRAMLKQALAAAPVMLDRLEAIVHPLVAADRAGFLDRHRASDLVVLDIPLLFETGAREVVDGVAVVSTDAGTQRRRVLARPGMTDETLGLILARQMPDAEKRARADWLIPSDTPEGARAAITAIIDEITHA
ncbi:dephospho-CoA kinase [Paracoccus spongiarum]|uniref:Dephospho-CoA kinase n=1 Tax=Paracoccus spongiarum TaxID=3064387 RepID=A0ABT9JB55_9RHOB|nr:dephospho-CoA kinase [Paracoccus sp. 2205BS29-5]MDP5307016.1 dephospho-CoA kinase [Paracoccus sp. 2205BS29-5]